MGNQDTLQQRPTRYPLRLRAEVQTPEKESPVAVEAWTRNVSANGLLLEMDQPLEPGAKFRLKLELPLPGGAERGLVDCVCRVVRVVRDAQGRSGIGAVIERYEFQRGEPK